MSPIYTPGKLILRRTYISLDDPDAAAYITAVETADGQPLEIGVRVAIHSFVKGCKSDGIWNAIKASCIMAGARTLAGALVPLVGPAPTRFGTEAGWNYNRKTGTRGNGANNYLNSNRNNNADPQNSKHLAVYQSSITTISSPTLLIATSNMAGRSGLVNLDSTSISPRINSSQVSAGIGNGIGFTGGVRTTSATSTGRVNGTNFAESISSQAPANEFIGVFATASGVEPTNARIAFYSIGESLDLALLDARITTLINAFAAAIP